MKLRVLLVPLLAVALALPATSAFADKLVKTDATGDVLKSDENGENPAPDQAQGDIVRTAIIHGPSNVTVKIAHRQLDKVGRIVTYIAVKSDKGRSAYRSITVVAAPTTYYGKVRVENANGRKVTCRTTRSLDYAANITTLTIPRRCLGSPRWVRVAVGVITTQNGFQAVNVDDARGNGTLGDDDPFFSTKVFR